RRRKLRRPRIPGARGALWSATSSRRFGTRWGRTGWLRVHEPALLAVVRDVSTLRVNDDDELRLAFGGRASPNAVTSHSTPYTPLLGAAKCCNWSLNDQHSSPC